MPALLPCRKAWLLCAANRAWANQRWRTDYMGVATGCALMMRSAFRQRGRLFGPLPLPFSIRLRPEAATFFDYERAIALPPSGHSNVLIPSDEAELPAFVALGILTRAEDLPAGRSVEVRRLTSAQTLEAVLPHAYCFSLHDEERKRRMLEQYLQMCARLPVFSIRFQPGLENLPAVLDAIEPLGKTS